MKRVTERAHEVVREMVGRGEAVIDATLGNGHDTLFLARLVGPGGVVYGFDVQAEAVEATRRRLLDAGVEGESVHLIHAGHETLGAVVPGPVAAIMFNLGYRPGGDRGCTTQAGSTVAALRAGWELLRRGGVISAVCYRGHEGGWEEGEAVCGWAAGLAAAGEDGEVAIIGREDSEAGPFLVVVRKGGAAPDQ